MTYNVFGDVKPCSPSIAVTFLVDLKFNQPCQQCI